MILQLGERAGLHPLFARFQQPVALGAAELENLALTVGATRYGKSNFNLHVARQLIAGRAPVCVLDPHADMARTLLETCLDAGREPVWFEVGHPHSIVAFNPLAGADTPQRLASLNVDALVRVFFADEDATRVARFTHALTNFLALLSATGHTYLELPRAILVRRFRDALALQSGDPRLREFVSAFDMLNHHEQYEQAMSTLIRIQPFIDDDDVRPAIGQPQSAFSLARLIEQDVFLAALPSLRIGDSAYVLSALLCGHLIAALKARLALPFHARSATYIFIDELKGQGGNIAELINLGKVGARPWLITQSLANLPPVLRETISANAGNLFAFFTLSPTDATWLARMLFTPDPTLMRTSADGTAAQVPFQEQLLHLETRVRHLERFCFMSNRDGSRGQRSVLRAPQVRLRDGERTEQYRLELLARYARPRAEVERELQARSLQLEQRYGAIGEALAELPEQLRTELSQFIPH